MQQTPVYEEYWTISNGIAITSNSSCRNCRKTIYKNEPIICRDGRKIRLTYHEKCFDGTNDPRTQTNSSFNEGRMPMSCFTDSAPIMKGYGKWSTKSYGIKPQPVFQSNLSIPFASKTKATK